MPLDPDTFRSVLGRFATGVTIVTVRGNDGRDHGMTVNAFSSVSLVPPLVLVCIDHVASTHSHLLASSHFAVNILAAHQEAISRRFAGDDEHMRFDGIGYSRGLTGAALLDDVLAHVECLRVAQHDAGDHTIVIGEVQSAVAYSERPLLYYRGGYAQLER
ncbi:MAG TPA: flavin reductase family protein [Gemmatimonadaceae bacterium]|nr:flavin reductase family protein [Gemmatimonadaceae bacterium]